MWPNNSIKQVSNSVKKWPSCSPPNQSVFLPPKAADWVLRFYQIVSVSHVPVLVSESFFVLKVSLWSWVTSLLSLDHSHVTLCFLSLGIKWKRRPWFSAKAPTQLTWELVWSWVSFRRASSIGEIEIIYFLLSLSLSSNLYCQNCRTW
jgi:hypothetical protein